MFLLFFCFFFFFFKQKTAYEISACLVGSEMCIRDRVKRRGIGEATLVVIEFGQIVEALRDTEIAGAKRLLVDRQRALVEWLGVGVTALIVVEQRQTTEAGRGLGAVGAG